MQNRELHQQDVQLVMARASDVMTPLMDMLYEKAFTAHQVSIVQISCDYHQPLLMLYYTVPYSWKFWREDILADC